MPRVRQWSTSTVTSLTSAAISLQDTLSVLGEGPNVTVLRTRAFFALAHEGDVVPPFNLGNPQDAVVLRVLAGTIDDPPDPDWPNFVAPFDDTIFHGFVWQPGVYVPANPDFGRPEHFFSNAYLAQGIADSAARRHFEGTHDIVNRIFLGPGPEGTGTVEPDFVAQGWIRTLIEYDA